MDYKTIEWNHINGTDSITTSLNGNSVCGKEANDFYFGLRKRMREGEFSGLEFDNVLISELYKSDSFKKFGDS